MKKKKEKIIIILKRILTVLLPKFFTLQLKYADFPTNAVTFVGILLSKCGSIHFVFMIGLNG